MTTVQKLPFEERYSVSEVIDQWHLWAVAITLDLKLLLLAAERPRDGNDPWTSASTRLRILDVKGRNTLAELETGMGPKFSHLQHLPDGGWLLAAPWPQGDLPNGRIYDAQDGRVRSLNLGGGIKDVQVSNDGQIWVSYFDEGIYGAGGSGEGLIGFDIDGNVGFRFSQLYESGLPPIDDCYALNVTNDQVWVYYYSAFPLVKLEHGRLAEWWKSVPIHGAGALAIKGDDILFAGSYEQRKSLYRFSLSTMQPVLMTPVGEDGQPINARRAFGRGNRMVLLTDDALFATSI